MNFEDLLTPKPYRWPKRGDLPFRKAKSAKAAGTLAADGLSRAVFIMDGFLRAGTALADLVLKEPHSRFDLVYPMLFCYRHSVETGLKWLITQYGPPVGVTPLDINDTHNLSRLWCYFDQINKACGARADDEALLAVGQIVKQFHDWDKGGVTFRYATAKDGAVAQFQHSNIDIENLKDVMSGVAHFSAGLMAGLIVSPTPESCADSLTADSDEAARLYITGTAQYVTCPRVRSWRQAAILGWDT